jgi:hypothetical protein
VHQQQVAHSDVELAASNSPKESTDRSRLGV